MQRVSLTATLTTGNPEGCPYLTAQFAIWPNAALEMIGNFCGFLLGVWLWKRDMHSFPFNNVKRRHAIFFMLGYLQLTWEKKNGFSNEIFFWIFTYKNVTATQYSNFFIMTLFVSLLLYPYYGGGSSRSPRLTRFSLISYSKVTVFR